MKSPSPQHADSDPARTEDAQIIGTLGEWTDGDHFILPSPEPYRLEIDPAPVADNQPLDSLPSGSLSPILDPAIDATFVDRALGTLGVDLAGGSDQIILGDQSVSPLIMGHGLPAAGNLSLAEEGESGGGEVPESFLGATEQLRNNLGIQVEKASTDQEEAITPQIEFPQLPPLERATHSKGRFFHLVTQEVLLTAL